MTRKKTATILIALALGFSAFPVLEATAAAPRLLEPLKLLAYDPANKTTTEGALNKFYLHSATPGAWEQFIRANAPMLNSGPSRKTGDYVSLAFQGAAIEVYSYRQSPCGFANIYIDGALKQKADLWSRTAKPESLIYKIDNLDPSKTHTLKIEVAGPSKNPSNANINLQHVIIHTARETTPTRAITTPDTLPADWPTLETKPVTFKVADQLGAPLPGALITIINPEFPTTPAPVSIRNPKSEIRNSPTATTAPDGSAVIKLPAEKDREFTYTIVKDGYFHTLRKLALCSSCPAAPVENITLRPHVPWLALVTNNFESNDPAKNKVKFSNLVRRYNTGPGWYLVGEARNPGVYRTFSSDVHISFTAGDWFEYPFTGPAVRLFIVRNPSSGLAKVTIDGANEETIDCYAPLEPHGTRNESYQLAYERHNLAPGPHKLRLEVLGKRGANPNTKGTQTNVLLDFLDHADYPVFERFNRAPSTIWDITTDTVELRQALVTPGPAGLASVQEAGFVILDQAARRAPTINDLRLPAAIDADGRFAAIARNLKPRTRYVTQPYAIIKNIVYYGVEPRTFMLVPRIVLNNELIARLPGATVTLQVNKLPPDVPAIRWSIATQHKYDGTPADNIIKVVFNGNKATITTVSEGQAIIRATSTANPDDYADCEVTVARAEKNPHVARTPPMGWATWGEYVRDVSADLIYEQADAMAAPIPTLGASLRDAGYEYLVIDGGWRQDWLEPDGRLVPDYHSFGGIDGLKKLFAHIHALGLKTGLHNTPGYGDCAGQPNGTADNPQLIMQQLADWGTDFIKWDHCSFGPEAARSQDYDRSLWTRTKYYMDNCGRDIVFYACVGNGNGLFKDWVTEVAHAWLTVRDIATIGNNNHNGGASWNINYGTFSTAIYEAALFTATLSDTAGPGHWNDPNFIPVGDPALNLVENQSTFNLWCMLSSPLLLSGDLRTMIHNAPLMKIITNKEMLAIDQDTLKAGKRIKSTTPAGAPKNAADWRNFNDPSLDTWARPLSDGTWAVMLVNNTSEPRDITVKWSEVLYDPHHKMAAKTYTLRDLNTHTDLGQFTNTYTARAIPPHGTVVLKASTAQNLPNPSK